ncbi:unnamed protein product [Closterium sp. Yama58-4]|nr:unnamed protein product [Closterium sp. Yama58-4]
MTSARLSCAFERHAQGAASSSSSMSASRGAHFSAGRGLFVSFLPSVASLSGVSCSRFGRTEDLSRFPFQAVSSPQLASVCSVRGSSRFSKRSSMAAEVGRAGGAPGGGTGESPAERERALIHVAAPPASLKEKIEEWWEQIGREQHQARREGKWGGGERAAEGGRAAEGERAEGEAERERARRVTADEVTEKKLVAVSQVLALLPISLFPKVTTVHEVTANTTLYDAIKLLSRHNLTTVPVRSIAGEAAGRRRGRGGATDVEMTESEQQAEGGEGGEGEGATGVVEEPAEGEGEMEEEVELEEEWEPQYLGMMDLAGAVILWVFANLEASSIGYATASTLAASLVGSFVAAAGAAALGASAGPAAAAAAAGAAAGSAAAPGGQEAAEEGSPGKELGSYMATAMASRSPARTGRYFFEELLKNEAFHTTRVADLAGSFRWSPFVYLKPSDTLLTLFLLMSKYAICSLTSILYAIRSVPVLPPGPESAISTVITQSAAVGFLCECDGMPWFNSIADCTLAELGLPLMQPEELVKVEDDAAVTEPFRLMMEHDIGGVPVVGKGCNRLIANISARDILHLVGSPEIFKRRQEQSFTVRDFIAAANEPISSATEVIWPVMTPPITCSTSTPLRNVLHALNRTHIHRIYVTASPSPAAADAPAPAPATAGAGTEFPTGASAGGAAAGAAAGAGAAGGAGAVSAGQQEVIGVVTLRDIIGKFAAVPADVALAAGADVGGEE